MTDRDHMLTNVPGASPTRWIVAMALVTAIGACGTAPQAKSSAGSPHAPIRATTTTQSAPPETIDAAADGLMATNMVLQLHDFPAQWAGSPHTPDAAQPQHDRDMAACLGIPDHDPSRTANADSQDFATGETTVSSSAEVFTKASVVSTDAAALVGPKAKPCFEALIRGTVTAGDVITSLDVTITPGPAPGRTTQKAAASVHVIGTSGGQPFDGRIEMLFLSKGRVEAEVDVASASGTVPANWLELAGDRVSARLADAV